MILLVGEDLAHHVDDRPAQGDEQALLAVGRKAHVTLGKRLAMRGRDRLLAETGDVERRLALTLRQEHPRVERAGEHHVAQALAQIIGVERPGPLADGLALVVERPDHRIGVVAYVGRVDVDRRATNLACFGDADMAEVGPAAGPHGRLGHVQRKAGAGHRVSSDGAIRMRLTLIEGSLAPRRRHCHADDQRTACAVDSRPLALLRSGRMPRWRNW